MSNNVVLNTSRVNAPELMPNDDEYGTTRSLTIPLDPGVTLLSYGCFISAFDISFQDGNHEIYVMALGVESASYDADNHQINVTVWMQLDKNHEQNHNVNDGSYISPTSWVDIVTVVATAHNSDDSANTFGLVSNHQSNDASTPNVTVNLGGTASANTGAVAGMAGFKIENAGGVNHNKLNNIYMNAGELNTSFVSANKATFKNVVAIANTRGGKDFNGTCHSFYGLTPNPLGVEFAVVQHQVRPPSFSFSGKVDSVCAVIKMLTNNGAGSNNSSALSSFDCPALDVSVNHEDESQVDISWPHDEGKWTDGLSSWDNVVDYLIIAQLSGK